MLHHFMIVEKNLRQQLTREQLSMRKHALNGSVHRPSVSEFSSALARIDSNVVIGSAFALVWREGVFKSELLSYHNTLIRTGSVNRPTQTHLWQYSSTPCSVVNSVSRHGLSL